MVAIWPWQTWTIPRKVNRTAAKEPFCSKLVCVVIYLNTESSAVELRRDAARLIDVLYTEAERNMLLDT